MKIFHLLKSVLLVLLVFGTCQTGDLYAVPAIPSDILFKQPDGTTFTARLKGDEWFNWVETDNRRVVIKNSSTGYYEYAVIRTENGAEALSPSGIVVREEDKSLFSESFPLEPITGNDLKRLAKQAYQQRNQIREPID